MHTFTDNAGRVWTANLNVATLKRVRLYDDHVVLEPENPQYRPIVYWGIDMNAVRILLIRNWQ